MPPCPFSTPLAGGGGLVPWLTQWGVPGTSLSREADVAGVVHSGFRAHLDALYDDLVRFLARTLKGRTLFITGVPSPRPSWSGCPYARTATKPQPNFQRVQQLLLVAWQLNSNRLNT